jgi:hypothetical protein
MRKMRAKKTLCIWGGCGCEWGVQCGSLVREHRMGGEACAESRELLSPGGGFARIHEDRRYSVIGRGELEFSVMYVSGLR